MRIKLYSMLLLLAPLFLSSYKIDNSKNVIAQKNKPLVFSTVYNAKGEINITSSEVGYYRIPISANVNYYTVFGSPNKNMINSISDFTSSYTLNFVTAGDNIEYDLVCTLNSNSVLINNISGYSSATLGYTIVVTKKVPAYPGHPAVTITRTFNQIYTHEFGPGSLPFEIEY